jgi:hypothetical protein
LTRKSDPKRRELLKKAAYVAPAVLSLKATSALAKSGSEKESKKGAKKGTKRDVRKSLAPPKKKNKR